MVPSEVYYNRNQNPILSYLLKPLSYPKEVAVLPFINSSRSPLEASSRPPILTDFQPGLISNP